MLPPSEDAISLAGVTQALSNDGEDETTIGDKEDDRPANVTGPNPRSRTKLYATIVILAIIVITATSVGLALGMKRSTQTSPTMEVQLNAHTCCNPAKEPGVDDNPVCLDGHACCPDGTWSCSIGDGQTFTCGNELVQTPEGRVCRDCLNSNNDDVGCLTISAEVEKQFCNELGCANIDCTETACVTAEEARYCLKDCETYACFRGCSPIVIGRPFKETADGNSILAKAYPEECLFESDICTWSNGRGIFSTDYQENDSKRNNERANKAVDTAADWVEQGLGEHASIASFAAFTISLMTNQAPPHLLREALEAALDELDHAERSFGLARLLAPEDIVVPGPLPASYLSFEPDLTSLVRSTAQEGCIGETMSALELAIQADQLTAALESKFWVRQSRTDRILLENKWKIAMDEARHSSLAWKTIQWVCQTDEVACTVVQDEVLNAKYLSTATAAFAERFDQHGAILLEGAWEHVYNLLLPLVIPNHDEMPLPASVNRAMDESSMSRVSLLVDMIVNGVSASAYKSKAK